jgi:hypothetical protein
MVPVEFQYLINITMTNLNLIEVYI